MPELPKYLENRVRKKAESPLITAYYRFRADPRGQRVLSSVFRVSSRTPRSFASPVLAVILLSHNTLAGIGFLLSESTRL